MSKKPRKPHFAGAIIYRETEGNFELLIQGSVSLDLAHPGSYGKLQMKWPGGTNRDSLKTWDARKTARREIREELWLKVRRGVNPDLLCVLAGDKIDMFFYFINFSDLQGKLRDKEIMDGLTKLLVPEWVSIEKASEIIYSTHEPTLIPLAQYFETMNLAHSNVVS